MDKALEMGKVSAAGSFKLLIGKIVSTVVLALSTILLGIFILQSDYGLYTIALIPATTFLLFQDWGVGSAMLRYCARCRMDNKEGEMRRIIVVGMIFEVATALLLFAFSLLAARFLASSVFGKPESTFLIVLGSVTILPSVLLGTSQNVFAGFEKMGLFSITVVCQAVTQGILVLVLVFLGYGALGAVIGYTLSMIISGITSVIMLYFLVFRKLHSHPNNESHVNSRQTLKMLLDYGIPLAIAAILSGILTQVLTFMIGAYYDPATIGNYKIATNFALLLTLFTTSIGTVLFPAFSKIDPQKDQTLLRSVFTSSVKYTSVFLVPAAMVMIVLSNPLIDMIYSGKWLLAPNFLALLAMINLFVIFGTTTSTGLLQAVGETKAVMKLNVLKLFIGVPLAFLLAAELGLPGIIIDSIICGFPSAIIALYLIWKHYRATVDFKSSAKILVSAAIAGGVVYLSLNMYLAADWLRFSVGLIVFLTLYTVSVSSVGAITQTDINNLRIMFSGLGLLSKIVEVPLKIFEKLQKILHAQSYYFKKRRVIVA